MTGCCKSRHDAEKLRRFNGSVPWLDDELEALICDCIKLLLPTLPSDEAAIISAIDVDGASPHSVAGTHGYSEDKVKSHLEMGRLRLQSRFGEMQTVCPNQGLSGCDCLPIREGH